MKIKRFNENIKSNYTEQSLINQIKESDILMDMIFEYYYQANDIDINEEYYSPRNVNTDGKSIFINTDTEYETNTNIEIEDIDDLIVFINDYKFRQDTNKYNL